MRIIHIVHGKANPSGHNGISRVVYHLNKNERKLGVNSEIWAVVDNVDKHFTFKRDKYVSVECFPRVRIPFGSNEIIDRLFAENESIDLVHFHMIWFFDKNIIARALKHAKIPFIITTHGTYSKPHAMTGKRRVARLLYERVYLNAATEIHAITEDEVEKLKHYGYNGATFIAPNGIALEEVPIVRQSNMFLEQKKPGLRRFIWIGQLRDDKNLVSLFHAVKMLSEDNRDKLKIFIFGPDYNNNEKKYKAIVTELGVVDNFQFMGPIYNKDKYNALESADVHILPSISEVFSLAMLDAMACAKPCLVTKGCGYEPWQKDNFYLSFDPVPKGIAEAIEKMLSLNSDWNKMGQNARSVIERDLNWSTISRTMIENYERILNA